MNKGLVQIYTGEGKGKTTAAFGLAVRAAGRGLAVSIIQFFKAEETGEVLLLKDKVPEITIFSASSQKKFSWKMNDAEIEDLREETAEGYKLAKEIITSGKCDLLILDEITYALNQNFIDTADCVTVLQAKPEHMEIVLTGRDASAEITSVADLVTEMKKIKHPFDRGIPARAGIEK